MKTQLSKKINLIINFLILISLLSGYTSGINPVITILIIITCLFIKVKKEKISKTALKIILILSILMLILLIPNFIYPTIRTDFFNHASISKILSFEKKFEGVHDYPRGTESILASFIQISPINFFQTTTIFSVFIFLLTALDFYTLSKKWANKKIALFSLILFSFSIPILWNIQLGFLPSLVGFYLVINYLKYEENNLSILNGASLVTVYPHYAAILFTYIALKYIIKKDFITPIKRIGSILLIGGYELFSILYLLLTTPKRTVLLLKGGIFVPNIFLIIIYFSLIALIFKKLKLKNFKENEFVLLVSIILLQCLIIGYFLLNYFLKITSIITLKQFYMVIKLFYLEMIPLSFIIGSKLKAKKLQTFFSILFITIFLFSLLYLKSNTYFNHEVFEIGHKINQLIIPNSTIQIDKNLLEEITINTPPFYYNSLVSLSNNNYTEIIRINLEKTFRTPWMKYENNTFYTYNNTQVFHYSNESDYYIGYNKFLKGNYLFNGTQLVLIKIN